MILLKQGKFCYAEKSEIGWSTGITRLGTHAIIRPDLKAPSEEIKKWGK